MNRFAHAVFSHLHLNITGVEPPHGFTSMVASLLLLLGTGTVFYHYAERWSFFDSFYFTVVTVTTVGYGDLHPTTVLSKVFTIFLLFTGVGLGLYVITSFADSLRVGREKRAERLESLVEKLLGKAE